MDELGWVSDISEVETAVFHQSSPLRRSSTLPEDSIESHPMLFA